MATLINPQSRLVTVSRVTPSIIDQLRLKHGETLSCPCSTISIPYEDFISHAISFDPVCTSVFISRQWIEALYMSELWTYDFRQSARSQFELLAVLCSFSNDTVSQGIVEIGNNQLITIQFTPEDQIQSQVNATIESVMNNLYVQINSTLQFLQIITRSNHFFPANKLDYFGYLYPNDDGYEILDRTPDYCIFAGSSNIDNYTYPAVLVSVDYFDSDYYSNPDYAYDDNTTGVSGFWQACYQLDAIFKSTLDCLYDANCLALLVDCFPSLNDTNLTSSILSSSPKNVSIENRLSKLFVDEWSTMVNYSKYVEDCAPLFCTYAITDQTNLSYTITLLLSLYGGLVIMLRFIAASVVSIAAKTKFRLPNINIDSGKFLLK
ncbi:unnamed protein product [Adineta steineri]|uniref:Uncharacterized protein n=1 Tax=Adineta steineri TaxID=433720 RepID=A0A818S0N9_9BILA|nr:unnamed protein product [Adineta steineri]CAF1135210.1 unnamed protein product [Adineta steineri]CAF1437463.1 unnamed protein product [Adineta steineri]CAF3665954.1 unnamed protein product [Adineta steineri]CAF3918428.1 unnamed protein product [Adineta steineri]